MLKASGSDDSSSRPLDLRDLAGLAWRQRWLMLVVLALCAAIAALACIGLPSVYRSTALILYDPAGAGAAPGLAAAAATPAAVDAEIEILQSDTVLAPVAARLLAEGLGDQPGSLLAELRDRAATLPRTLIAAIRGRADTPPDRDAVLRAATERLGDRFTVTRRGLTAVIAIQAQALRPELAAHIANLVAAVYLEQGFAAKRRAAIRVRDGAMARRDAAERRWLEDGAAASRHGRVDRPGRGLEAAFFARETQLQDRARASQALFQLAVSQVDGVEQQIGVLQSDARLVAEATRADTPASPPRPLIAAGVLMIGLCTALGAGHLADRRRRPATDAETEAVLGRPVLAALPRLAGPDGGRHAVQAAVETPHATVGEALKRLRYGVERMSSAPGRAPGALTVLVTSTAAREGKTVTAAALARTLALHGVRTLLIDCDLVGAGLAALMDVALDTGLGDHLAGFGGGLPAFARRDAGSGADMLMGLPDEDAASDRLLASPAFAALLGPARGLYDVVILDAPAVGSSIDPLVLLEHADLCLYVIGWGTARQEAVEHGLQTLQRSRAVPVGLVLNSVAPVRHGAKATRRA